MPMPLDAPVMTATGFAKRCSSKNSIGTCGTIHSLGVNQGIAFARTLRALEADDFRTSKVGLLAAALVMAAWVWWLVAARVPHYESTTNVRIEDGRAFAYFPATGDIQPGQTAILHFNGTTISAQVASVASDHAELALAAKPPSPNPVSIEIETSRVSPASLALQALGRRTR